MGSKWWLTDASEWHRRIRDIRNKPNLFRGPEIGIKYAPRDGPLLRRLSPVLKALSFVIVVWYNRLAECKGF